jgi:hypothetical protein
MNIYLVNPHDNNSYNILYHLVFTSFLFFYLYIDYIEIMKVLELFSGTHSIGVVCKELNYEVISVDRDIGDTCEKINPSYKSRHHIKTDIMTWNYKEFSEGSFDIITASPVCTWWSNIRKCNYGKVLKGYNQPFSEKIYLQDIDKYGKPMVNKVFEIIDYFKPKYWWIENPKTSLMWKYIKEIKPHYDNYNSFDYCKFSNFGYKKSTIFLSNIPNLKGVACKNDCGNIKNMKHLSSVEASGGGSNRLERYRIPKELVKYLFNIIAIK